MNAPRFIRLRARSNQHYVSSGLSLLAVNLDGWATGNGTEGFYYRNTRLLSRNELLIDGVPPRPASVSPVDSDAFLALYELRPGPDVPERSVYLAVRRRVDEGMRSEFEFTNYGRTASAFDAVFRLEADFADSDEAEAGVRRQEAPVKAEWCEKSRTLRFRYEHPGLDRAVGVRLEGAFEPRFVDGGIVFRVDLPARDSKTITLLTEPIFDGVRTAAPASVFPAPSTPMVVLRGELRDGFPRLRCTNASVQRAWDTALADLASLPLGMEGAPATPAAGLPLYQQFFGRDSLTISWQSLLATPRLLRDSLLANARWQGTRIDDYLDEEPGKMIHQMRWGPTSTLGLDAFARYYGDWATPPDFLAMLAEYLYWTDDRATVRSLLPAARRVLDWIDRYGDLDGDGFLEYRCRSPKGVHHQGWKDSDDAIVTKEGEVIDPPLATCEIQGYWYAGLQLMAGVFALFGDVPFAAKLQRQAARLRKRFDAAYWMPGEQFHAMGIGPGRQMADAVSSNPGQLLVTGILPLGRAQKVAKRLLAPDMFSGWGVRTLSSENGFYNPFSYHRGSVWPVEQGTIALGFARHGLTEDLFSLTRGVFDLAELFEHNRLPEVVGGLPRDETHPHPGIYPYSCAPQGWSASALVAMVQALLGIHPVAPLRVLFIDPHLPEWLPEVSIDGIRVRGGEVSLRLERKSTATHVEVTRNTSGLKVLQQPAPSSGLRPIARAKGLARSLL